ncbi:hypothetical protein K1719_024287 [Acacia pycnantha]|nr:hypothetical protein K1719_024287 [Acacia pycnantha]
MLITIKIHGSAGPLRFLVNDDYLVSHVIKMTLKYYARQRRLPYLGFDIDDFLLHYPVGLYGLSPTETIGSCGGREFTLIKKNLNCNVGLKYDTQKQKQHFKWKSCFVIQPNSVLSS